LWSDGKAAQGSGQKKTMGAHRFVRFTKFELELREAAGKTLASDTANIAEKRHARRVLSDTLAEAQGRHVMAKARKVLGPKPCEPGPALDAWRDELKRIKADAILDDPRSSLAQTRLAERTLKDIEVRERQRGPAPRKRKAEELQPPADDISPDVRRFFDGELETKTTIAPQPEAEKPRPAPREPQVYCDIHEGPIEVCKCNEVCPLCLVERRSCGHRG
jgi:hypothetical protein